MYKYKDHKLGCGPSAQEVHKLGCGTRAHKVHKGCWQVGGPTGTGVLWGWAAVDVPWLTWHCRQSYLPSKNSKPYISLTMDLSTVIKI